MNEISKMTDNERDRAVALDVMGWKITTVITPDGKEKQAIPDARLYLCDWEPSRDYNQAFQVVERMRKLKWRVLISTHLPAWNEDKYSVIFTRIQKEGGQLLFDAEGIITRAICEAALEAVRSSRE